LADRENANRRNILFLMSDSLTPHLTGPYGDTVGSTPNLDNLASMGVLFENAYCNSPLCAPSRASMVTGRYVSEIGCFDNASAFLSEWPTMGHVLGAAGYETVIIGNTNFLVGECID
jgi:choline-sulfatase